MLPLSRTAAVLLLALTIGCTRNEVPPMPAPAPAPAMGASRASLSKAAGGERARSVMAESAAPGAEPPAQRFLAVRHDLSAEVTSEQLPAAWATVRDLCGTLRCELLSSALQRETPQQPGHASLEMRVLPADVEALLGGLSGVAQVVSHNTTSEDKTAEVIDVEAHIKNRTEFRDSLRAMLADSKTKRDLGDILSIQSTLADTQAQLDSGATQRKVLEQQTSKQHLTINFAAKRVLVGGTSYSPIRGALRNAGAVLAESVGALITFVAVALPWLLLAVPVLWVGRLLWRRRARTQKRID
ncbi:DUF4349 domain-containing protein [Variovorax sp. PAMC 28711]|uniref:DUF4349 domain-containing protein n=1 Tax=Variovorax sp. PAMC 28711 TaxID=1795631 RepID=UPI001F21814C|nr:DUF4349 domain-containing protein [Variovorax sp. PAMC 28711]